jgi:MYXO-CTERM domain-containing protein
MRRRLLLLGPLAALLPLAVKGYVGREARPALRPAPTENWLDEEAEERAHAGRATWMRQMHRSPPDVDWEGIERQNGLAQVRRHRALASAAAPPDDTSGPRWVERGSDNQAGRMHVARLSTDGTRLYAGSAFGGLWRGTLDGEDWTPLGDDAYGGVHFLEVVPGASAGDPDVLVTASDGGIVLRSTDGGASWESTTDLGAPWWTRRLVQTADEGHTLFVVSVSNDGVRLFRSVDRGVTWQVIHDFAGYYGDVWAPREGAPGGGDGALYLLDADALRVSFDRGDTWEEVGAIPTSSGTGDLTASEAGAPTLYAVLDDAELWRSEDAGADWTDRGALTDYWGGSLNASTVDDDLFVYGGVELHKSFDGGGTFTTQNGWDEYYGDPANLLHADIDGIDVIPDGAGGETWYVGCDGGLYRSLDTLDSVENLSQHGLRVGQYYDVLTSSADPTHVAIGAQDQGYQLTNDVAQDDDVYEADQILSGDYGHLTSGDGTHDYVFSVYPGFILVQHGETDPVLSYLDFPGGESYVPWLPPVVADPEEPADFYFPASHVYKYTHGRPGVWHTALWSEQDFAIAPDEYVSRMEFSPVDPDRVWATTSYGRVWWSDDHGVTWTMSPSLVPDDNWYYGQALAPSRTDRDAVTVGGSGYGVPAVYQSTDGGHTFRPYGEGLPDTLVYTLVEAADGSGTLFAGTQTAAYRRGPADAAWEDITGADAPITTYWDAEALVSENTIRFATYGRGVWDYQLDPEGVGCFPVQDRDGDGIACDTDCADDDVAVFPGAVEACDGVDVDCDPATPAGGEGDADDDGARGCVDCADDDPVRFPGATELCGDGIDEDCDGADPRCAADGADDTDDTDMADADAPAPCGCATTPDAPGLGLLLGLALLRRRRA